LVVAGDLFGIFGMFLAAPAAAVLRVTFGRIMARLV
jgi:predicted PurR-regulated permease PerM